MPALAAGTLYPSMTENAILVADLCVAEPISYYMCLYSKNMVRCFVVYALSAERLAVGYWRIHGGYFLGFGVVEAPISWGL